MRKKISFGISVMLVLTMVTGCGVVETANTDPGRNIELVEPVNSSVDNMETVQRRNLYDATVYEANVYPYVEEYAFEDKSYNFDAYTAYPGDMVKKGQVLMYTNAEELDKQIEAMETRIRKLTDDITKYGEKAAEEYAALKEIVTIGEWALGEMEGRKPEEFIIVNGSQVENPEYTTWQKEYEDWTVKYNKALFDIDVLHLENDQKVALYNLDYEYYNGQLQELLAEKKASSLYAQMDGQVVAIQQFYDNERITVGLPVIAVADMSRKFVKCDFIDPRLVKTAYDIYAFIGGKRYEVTYQETEDERCSTFVLQDENNETSIGDYAILVYMKKGTEYALTLSNEAIHQDVNKKYVHILENGVVTTREIRTGISDGKFTEILSGLEEGDQVVVGDVQATGINTEVLTREAVSTMYGYAAQMYYPIYDYVRNTNIYVTTYFGEYLVPIYQDVKKGDPIVRITVESDLRVLEEKETELRRERERLADYIEENKENMETNESVVTKISTWQETIEELEQLVEDMRKEYTSTTLVSPIDGKVESLFVNEEYDEMYGNQPCAEIVDTSVGFLVAESKGFINYGTELEVSYTTMDNKAATCTGMVVTLGDWGVSEELGTDDVLIKLPEGVVDNLRTHTMMATSGHYTLNKITVTGVGKVMENVVKIPADAVKDIDGKTYVDVLQPDGTVTTMPFLSGGHTRAYYWAIDGLDEGMIVCW